MLIAVCDDQSKDRAGLAELLRALLEERRVAAELREYASGEALLAALDRDAFSVCFLDIFMEGISGVAAARHIRQRKLPTAIVFTTSSPDYMADGFEVGAVHYLVKPFTRGAVETALERCLYLAGEAERFVEVTVEREPRRVLLSALRYAEVRNNACTLFLTDGALVAYLSLEELSRLLDDPRFLRCQRSFLVNLDHVAELRGNDFLLADGARVPVSREGRGAMKARFEQYLFEKARRRR